jgi:hypothetical protein
MRTVLHSVLLVFFVAGCADSTSPGSRDADEISDVHQVHSSSDSRVNPIASPSVATCCTWVSISNPITQIDTTGTYPWNANLNGKQGCWEWSVKKYGGDWEVVRTSEQIAGWDTLWLEVEVGGEYHPYFQIMARATVQALWPPGVCSNSWVWDGATVNVAAPPPPPPSLQVVLSGPDEIEVNGTCTWEAFVVDPPGTVTYEWYNDMQHVGYGYQYTGGRLPGSVEPWFNLRVVAHSEGEWGEDGMTVFESELADVCIMR